VQVLPKCLEASFNPLVHKSLNLHRSIIFPIFVEV